jgi:hypothetical protein
VEDRFIASTSMRHFAGKPIMKTRNCKQGAAAVLPSAVASDELDGRALERSIPQLVGEIYESASPSERSSLLVPLLRPLGVLSLLGVANGIFASVRFRSGWPEMRVQLDAPT